MALNGCSSRNYVHYLAGRSVRPSFRQEDLFLRQRFTESDTLHWKNLVGHYGCVNAIEFSHGQGTLIASGGDDRRVFLWNVEKALSDIGKPAVMRGEHNSNIFCVAFDIANTTAFSGGNDEQVIVHDLTTGETKDVFSHDDAVYGLSPDPTNPYVFATSCDDGRVLIFDTRDSCADPFCLANYTSSMHSVMYNPVEPRLLATANAKEGVGLWDVRKPRSCLLRYGGSLVQQSCMSVKFNQRGNYIIALRRRLPPVLYNIASHQPVCEFDHRGYYNSCTMKSVCFAGDNDQYILSGSDEFNLYMWALPDDLSERSYINSAHMVLKGHRSIVNQVRFNPANHLIISSGVEKIIKVWSPFKLPEKHKKERSLQERRVFTHEEYINLVLQNGNVMSHDYSQESTEEDPRMMAFFDSLVQRELDGWSSDDSMSSNEEALYSRIIQLSQSDIDSDDSFPDLGENEHDDPAYSPFTIAFASVMASQAAEGNDSFPRLNHALENAERVYAETSDGHEVMPSSEGTQVQSLPSENTSVRSLSEVSEESSSLTGLTTLRSRKKEELKESVRRRALTEVLVCDSDEKNDKSESDESSVSSLNIVIGSNSKNDVKEIKKPEGSKASVSTKHTLDKLQHFKNLRKSVMVSDSHGNDLEIHEKKLNTETFEVSPSDSIYKTGEEFEKVQFKKFKRRNKMKSDMPKTESKEELKSRASPDLGPFLQKAGTSTSVEVRRSLDEDRSNRGKLSSDSFSYKGKQKLKSSHRPSYIKRSENPHSHDSEHQRTSDLKCDDYKNKNREKERNKKVKGDRREDSTRLEHKERKCEPNGTTDRHEGKAIGEETSSRNVIENRKPNHTDSSSEESDGQGDGKSAIDTGLGETSQHRRRVMSASYTTLDIDERRYKYYSEGRETIQRPGVRDMKNENKSEIKKESKNCRKTRCDQALKETVMRHSYSEDGFHSKRLKDSQGMLSNKIKVDDDRFDETQGHIVACGKNSSFMGDTSAKNDADGEIPQTDQYYKKCARLHIDGKEEVNDDENSNPESEGRRYCKGSVDCKDICLVAEEVVQTQVDNDSGISNRKLNSFSKVAANEEEKPSCSYPLKSSSKSKHKVCESRTHQSENKNEKSEKKGNCKGRQATHDESRERRSSSSNEEDHLTWVEFKRFKNRLERAHKRYKKERHNRRNKRSLSDEK